MITLKKTFVNHILKFLIRFSANAALNSVQSIFATTIVIPAFFCYIYDILIHWHLYFHIQKEDYS